MQLRRWSRVWVCMGVRPCPNSFEAKEMVDALHGEEDDRLPGD